MRLRISHCYTPRNISCFVISKVCFKKVKFLFDELLSLNSGALDLRGIMCLFDPQAHTYVTHYSWFPLNLFLFLTEMHLMVIVRSIGMEGQKRLKHSLSNMLLCVEAIGCVQYWAWKMQLSSKLTGKTLQAPRKLWINIV